MKKYWLSACAFLMLGCATTETQNATAENKIDGYPVANFALTANVGENGDLYGKILQNTGTLGDWLQNKGRVQFFVEKDGKKHSFSDFKKKDVQRTFPFVNNTYYKSPIIDATIAIQTFCPLAVNEVETSALPVIMLEMTCTNPTKKQETFTVRVVPDSVETAALHAWNNAGLSGVADEEFLLSCNGETQWQNDELTVSISLQAGEQKTLHIALAFYDESWVSAKQFASVAEVTEHAHHSWDTLKEKTATFSAAIPQTGDAELDKYLHWYIIPGISLTKCTKNDEILTMGYCELNQRDSYWTSWLHLVLFKDAERKMIDESAAWEQPSGKIPTTILPLIERHDDLDINAFFILRAIRYYNYHHDREALAAWWQPLKKAMDWLITRDTDGDGLPVQVSFWGDWKDVLGVQGRKYSPFSGMVYLAALNRMAALSSEMNDHEAAQKYRKAYDKGYAFLNKPTDEGGLWNGNYYCQRWNDGSVNTHLLQDQMIGVLYDVVPRDRAEKITHALNTQSLTAYGIAETTPYYPSEWGYKSATYHNGGVWPWLSFMDCWARIQIGRKDEAVKLIKTVALADLVNSGDWSPNEHLNSLTGENLGFILQGWNAGLFGVVYFGLNESPQIP
ncbi:MAG: hypothetical protein LBT48_03065 [Prevotellaceae bacterium]|jgi:uncharacterized protein (DUF608 family)|nr:hypothetical protein [Prevotellaceae bacterium]